MTSQLMAGLGLNQYSDGDVSIIMFGVLAMCIIAGIVADFVMKPAGYGVVGNALLLMLGFVIAMLAFGHVHQNPLRAEPLIRLTFGMSIAFFWLFAASYVKKAVSRTG